MAPLAGRWFDRSGGRLPLTAGFLVLAVSCFVLAAAFPTESVAALVPGLLLQGIGLGIVLTVNDPTGLGSVPAEDQGAASGVIDTSEQLGGAVGIAVFSMVLLHIYFGRLFELLARRGIKPTQGEMHQGREFVLRAEQKGLHNVTPPSFMRSTLGQFEEAHIHAYQLTFVIMGAVAIVGAIVCWLLVRKDDHLASAIGIFSRRSRWTWAAKGEGPGLTRKPVHETPGRSIPGEQSQPGSEPDG